VRTGIWRRGCRRWLLSGIALGLCACGDDGNTQPRETYYLVSHGPTTDVGFWGEVFDAAEAVATRLGVDIEPLHPAVETTGAELNALMRQAVDARPAGIIATIWGDGMPAEVMRANQADIPVAAINVYPDVADYGPVALDGTAPPGKAGFLLYSGQNDADAADEVARSLVCLGGAGAMYTDGSCGGTSVADAWTALTNGATVRAVCIIHQQSAGVLTRCEAMKAVMNEVGLPAAQYEEITWNEAVPDAGKTAVQAYFADPARADVDHFLVMSNGPNGAAAYLAADIAADVEAKIVIGTFDTSDAICDALTSGALRFASSQGHRDQAAMALAYLHHYVHGDRTLPEPGKAPDGSDDARWTTSADNYRWYKTGPQLLTQCP